MDEPVFLNSLKSDNNSEPFVRRDLAVVLDSNSGNFANSSCVIETSSLSNSGRMCALSEATLQIPIVATLGLESAALAGTADTGSPPVLWTSDLKDAVAFKNGWHNIISSMQVEYQNGTVVQLTPNYNAYVNFKMMTEYSQDDLIKNAATNGCYPDTATSIQYKSANNTLGRGLVNNSDYNTGLLQRKKFMCRNPATPTLSYLNAGASASATTGLEALAAKDAAVQTLQNRYEKAASDAKSTYHAWYWLATVRLGELHDFFRELPLTKSPFIKITLNFNNFTHVFTQAVAASGVAGAVTTDSISCTGTTCPIMICPQKLPLQTAATNTYTLRCGVGSVTVTGVTSPVQHDARNIRLVVPSFTLSPEAQQKYDQVARIKNVRYTDIYSTWCYNVKTSSTFNYLITNSIARPRRLIIMPFLSSTTNGGLSYSPILSPFDSAPCTTSPIPLTNLQVQVSGNNVWTQLQDQDWDQFQNELRATGALNGGVASETGLTSGLISQLDFFSGAYRYYVADISRGLSFEDQYGKSISISGKNQGLLDIELLVFVEYQKEIIINTETGLRE